MQRGGFDPASFMAGVELGRTLGRIEARSPGPDAAPPEKPSAAGRAGKAAAMIAVVASLGAGGGYSLREFMADVKDAIKGESGTRVEAPLPAPATERSAEPSPIPRGEE